MPQSPYKHEYKSYLTLNDFYDRFDGKDEITKEQYKLISKTFNIILMKRMMNEGKVFYIPPKLGVFGVVKSRVYGKGVFDYNLFKNTGVKAWKKNLHSSLYAARFFWSQRYDRCSLHSNIFRWVPPRGMKRELAKLIKESNTIHKYYDKDEY